MESLPGDYSFLTNLLICDHGVQCLLYEMLHKDFGLRCHPSEYFPFFYQNIVIQKMCDNKIQEHKMEKSKSFISNRHSAAHIS